MARRATLPEGEVFGQGCALATTTPAGAHLVGILQSSSAQMPARAAAPHRQCGMPSPSSKGAVALTQSTCDHEYVPVSKVCMTGEQTSTPGVVHPENWLVSTGLVPADHERTSLRSSLTCPVHKGRVSQREFSAWQIVARRVERSASAVASEVV
jgi:hypothetical protein